MEFVSRERERVNSELVHIDGDVAYGLNGIGVKGGAVFMGDAGQLGDILDGSDLVVRKHDRNKSTSWSLAARPPRFRPRGFKGDSQIVRVHMSLPVDGQHGRAHAKALHRPTCMQHGMMLD